MKSRLTVTLRNADQRLMPVIALRNLVNPLDPADIKPFNESLDTIKVSQIGPGRFEIPQRETSQKKVSRL
jgi:hypothetical protein